MIVYTHPDCDYSAALKEELDRDGIDYKEIDLKLNSDAWLKVEDLTGGERITPVVVEGENVIVGFKGVG